MNIFEKPIRRIKKSILFFLPVLFLLIVCTVFTVSIGRVSGETIVREQATLEQALRNAAVSTYALSGQYPENLNEILANYSITYDKEKFVVEYIPNGANLFPTISVIPMKIKKGGGL